MQRPADIALRKDIPGIAYDLGPGDGVHHPVNAPHWVQNGDEVSVSLSLGLCLHDANRDAKIYQVNYLLRRIGLRPVPLGEVKWKDAAKAFSMEMISKKNPTKFDNVVFSGKHRLERLLYPLKYIGVR